MTTPRDAVRFTRESAERIANAVRTVELAPSAGRALDFDVAIPSATRKTFRMATFSGAWSRGASRTVTLRGSTTTITATNLLLDVPSAGNRNCAVAKDGTAWYLIFPQVRTRNVTLATGRQILSVVSGISLSGSLNTSGCSITIGSTLTTASITVQTGTFTATVITLESL